MTDKKENKVTEQELQEISKMNIYKKMSKITNEISRVAKKLQVQVTKTSTYKAVSEADILDAVKPIEEKYGVYSYPLERTIIENTTLEKETQYGTRKELYMRLEVMYRFVNIDNPSEYLDIKSYGDGLDSQDKVPGKAMTYADKYALMKAYKISTGDDPDQSTDPEKQQEEDLQNKLIDKVKLASIEAELKRTGVPAKQITDRYKVFELKELVLPAYTNAMGILAKMPDKQKPDLGL